MKQCNWCGKHFEASVSYQVYCSLDCREQATKEKIAERHTQLKRQRRKSRDRLCANGCGTKLSVYNDYNICDKCYIDNKEVNRKIKQIRMLMHDYEDDTTS